LRAAATFPLKCASRGLVRDDVEDEALFDRGLVRQGVPEQRLRLVLRDEVTPRDQERAEFDGSR